MKELHEARERMKKRPMDFVTNDVHLNFLQKARELVMIEYKSLYPDNEPLAIDEVYVVWFSKTLQNWKAMVSTSRPDKMYYEVTYDGDCKQTYVDAYKKLRNQPITDEYYEYFRE